MSVNDFLDMMTDTVDWATFQDNDSRGKPVYGAESQLKCRVVRKPGIIRGPDDRAINFKGTIWLGVADTTPPVKNNDLFRLDDGQQVIALNVEKYPDEGGQHHTKVMYG